MSKRKVQINHSEESVEVTTPEIAQDAVKSIAEQDPAENLRDAAEIGHRMMESTPETAQDVAKYTPVPALDAIKNAMAVLSVVDTPEDWNDLFFAIKALKNSPSEALKASKMRRLLEKLP